MTLPQYRIKNIDQLSKDWSDGECDNYPNFASYIWHQWQETGDCTYEDLQE